MGHLHMRINEILEERDISKNASESEMEQLLKNAASMLRTKMQ